MDPGSRALRAIRAAVGSRGRGGSLKLRVAATAGVLALAGMALVTAAALRISEADTRERLGGEQRQAALRAARQVGERIAERRAYLAAFAAGLPPRVSSDPVLARRSLAARPMPWQLFRTTFVSTPEGRIVARYALGGIDDRAMSIGDRPWFRAMLESRGPVTSEPVRSRATGAPSVVMLVPLLDPAGTVQSVVGALLPLDGAGGIGDIADGVDRSTRTVIVDRGGRVVAHADPQRLLDDARRLPELHDALARIGRGLRDEDLHGGGSFGMLTLGWAAVPGTDWALFEIVDSAELMAVSASARRLVVWTNVAVALAIGATMFGVLVVQFRPIGRLRDRALRVLVEPGGIEGDWPAGGDEIGELSRVFLHILRERAMAEEGSLTMLARLQAIMDTASAGIAFTRDGRFELASAPMAALTGHALHELSGRPVRMLWPDDASFAEDDARIAAMLARDGRFDLELPLHRRDGSTLWVRAVGSLLSPAMPAAGTVWVLQDVSDARSLRERLSWHATRDPLTELVNRREFEARLGAVLDDPARRDGAVLVLDLDGFKQVNDTGGHAAGDALLRGLATQFESQLRRDDTVARLGGDEFAVLLPGCPPAQARRIAARLRLSVRAHRLEHDGRTHAVGASIGLVDLGSAPGTLGQVLAAADAACYAAKRAGRDAVRAWDAAAQAAVEADGRPVVETAGASACPQP